MRKSASLLPESRSPLAWHDRRFAIALMVVAIAGCGFLSFGVGELPGMPPQWFMSHDVWWTTNSAQYVSYGGLGTVYAANPWYSALPGFPALLAPVVALGDRLGLTPGFPFPLARPTMWLLVGPFFFFCASTAVLGVDFLLDSLPLPTGRRRVIVAITAIFVVVPTAGQAGHPEDLLALALACVSVALLLRGRPAGAAYVMASAVLIQTWAVLLLPALVAAAPAGRRLITAVRAGTAPALVGLLLLALDWRDASIDLLRQPMPNSGQQLPWWSLAGHMTVVFGGERIEVASGSTTRSLAVLVAVALGVWVRRQPSVRVVLIAAGLSLFARGFFETEFWPYYLAPAAVILAVGSALCTTGSPKRFAVAGVGCFVLYASAPFAYIGKSYNPFIALLVLTACAGLVVGACAPAFGWRRPGRAEPDAGTVPADTVSLAA